MTYTRTFLLIASAVVIGSCTDRRNDEIARLNALWLPPESRVMHGPQSYRDGSADLVFELVDVVLEDVSEGFVRHFQFPWRAQPLFRGWTWEVVRGGGVVPVDSQGRPVKNEVHVWHGKWANDAGDVIAYDLTATTLENGGRSHVSGYARYLTPRK